LIPGSVAIANGAFAAEARHSGNSDGKSIQNIEEHLMPNHFVRLTPDVYHLVQTGIESGRYDSASEVLRAALRALHREQKISDQQHIAGGIAEADVFRKLWEKSVQSSRLTHE
jgi:putative addiction module CopG family antidote